MNAAGLVSLLEARLRDTRLVIVANREPYIHVKHVREHAGLWARLTGRRQTTHVGWKRPASGVVTALDPVMRACGGTWIAHGSGSGDREASDSQGRVRVPPDNPSYTLRRVWLSQEEEQGFYYGFSNNALWPLCHIAYARPDVAVCQFWHIPWPNPEAFRVCPWAEELLHGLLGNDLLAFHIRYHCNNFFDTVDKTLEARVDTEQLAVWRGGHATFVKPFPISIDPEMWAGPATPAACAAEVRATRQMLGLGTEKLIFGVDRLDYTKGIPDRLHAFERLLDSYPEWHERVVMFQVGAPSRDQLAHYRALSTEVEDLVRRINDRYATRGWTPVLYRREHHDPKEIAALYRAADVCVVSSLHDGMNLVAKEFIASRSDHRGVLVLSKFTGAARDMAEAILVNPYAIDEFAASVHKALAMDPAEQQRRMRDLSQRVLDHTVYDWAADVLREAYLYAGSTRP